VTAFFLVGSGGFLGALTRYYSGAFVLHHFGETRFPFATFFVNVLGCLLIGLSVSASARFGMLSSELRLLCVTGFLGSFTTFSAFGLETVYLLKRGDYVFAAANVVLSLSIGLAAVWFASKVA